MHRGHEIYTRGRRSRRIHVKMAPQANLAYLIGEILPPPGGGLGPGVGVVFGLKSFFKMALFALLGDGSIPALIIEYFLVVIVAALLFPMTFKPLNKLFAKYLKK